MQQSRACPEWPHYLLNFESTDEHLPLILSLLRLYNNTPTTMSLFTHGDTDAPNKKSTYPQQLLTGTELVDCLLVTFKSGPGFASLPSKGPTLSRAVVFRTRCGTHDVEVARWFNWLLQKTSALCNVFVGGQRAIRVYPLGRNMRAALQTDPVQLPTNCFKGLSQMDREAKSLACRKVVIMRRRNTPNRDWVAPRHATGPTSVGAYSVELINEECDRYIVGTEQFASKDKATAEERSKVLLAAHAISQAKKAVARAPIDLKQAQSFIDAATELEAEAATAKLEAFLRGQSKGWEEACNVIPRIADALENPKQAAYECVDNKGFVEYDDADHTLPNWQPLEAWMDLEQDRERRYCKRTTAIHGRGAWRNTDSALAEY